MHAEVGLFVAVQAERAHGHDAVGGLFADRAGDPPLADGDEAGSADVDAEDFHRGQLSPRWLSWPASTYSTNA